VIRDIDLEEIPLNMMITGILVINLKIYNFMISQIIILIQLKLLKPLKLMKIFMESPKCFLELKLKRYNIVER